MATIKSYSDIEQSKKLAEILPLESADMSWVSCDDGKQKYYQAENRKIILNYEKNHWLPCWSLAALLGVLPFHIIVNNQRYAFGMFKGLNKEGETYVLRYNVYNTEITLCETNYHNNLVDACHEMIIKLNELKLL